MTRTIINIARQFSKYPAGRYYADGPYPGEKCREQLLTPALRRGDTVVVQLDGTLGYGSSFLEEAFGGLVRHDGFDASYLLDHLILESEDTAMVHEIRAYITSAVPEPTRARHA